MDEKILIIDDDLDSHQLVSLMLDKEGYQIVAANDGEEGLLKTNQETPDLILLDIMMPGIDGYEVARRLRQNSKTDEIPVLIYTAKSQVDDRIAAFESGADGFLTKPSHPSELQAYINSLLSRPAKRGQKQNSQQD